MALIQPSTPGICTISANSNFLNFVNIWYVYTNKCKTIKIKGTDLELHQGKENILMKITTLAVTISNKLGLSGIKTTMLKFDTILPQIHFVKTRKLSSSSSLALALWGSYQIDVLSYRCDEHWQKFRFWHRFLVICMNGILRNF